MNLTRTDTTCIRVTRQELIAALRLLKPNEFLLQQFPSSGDGLVMEASSTSILLTFTRTVMDAVLSERRYRDADVAS